MFIKKTFSKRILPVMGGLFLSTLTLSGCELYDPVVETQLYPVQMRLQQDISSQTFSVDQEIDEDALQHIVERYNKAGEGPVTLTLRFKEGDAAQARKAAAKGAEYKKLLKKMDIKHTTVSMQPMPQFRQAAPEITLSYHAWQASRPVGCNPGRIPGYYGAEGAEPMSKYKMGCETETYLSRMVSNPKDLKGTSGTGHGESRREGPLLENYKTGVPNEPLEGFQASDLGEGS